MASTSNSQSIEIFYSYSNRDEEYRLGLEEHLSSLRRRRLIEEWHFRKIIAGTEWERMIDTHLNSARLILLLVSSSFIASDYCFDTEMKRAMERHDNGEAIVLPIILRPCDWTETPFARLQALPQGATPISQWPDRDEAFLNVVEGIRSAIDNLNKKVREANPTSATNTAIATTHSPTTAGRLRRKRRHVF